MAFMRTVKGIPVSPGLALGPLHVVQTARQTVPTWSIPGEEIEREVARLHEALERAELALARQQKIVAQHVGERDAAIFSVHRAMLRDPSSLSDVQGRIRDQRINAEAAIQALIDRFTLSLGMLEGDSVRGFASDFSDPWKAVLDALLAHEREHIEQTDEQVILAASELTPQVVTYLPRERVLAVVSETGGRFSHGAVLARSFGFPCVVGLPNLLSRLEQGMRITVDGDAGTVQLRPEAEDVDRFLARIERRRGRQKKLAIHAALPPVTPDGRRFSACVNIESLRDLDTFPIEHTDGVGLLRTEFLYMERTQFPSEEEQYRLYRRVVEKLGVRPVTLRTLDIGNDKQLPYFKTPKENNPALGWRGLRISLEWQDLLRVQLRAALRASAHGDLRILLPMVTSVEEIFEVHRIFDGVRRHLIDQGYEVATNVPVGVMVEVPSLVFTLPEVVREVDFVSVGTNDLVQYMLAVDRDNTWVSKLYDPYHPAVFQALSMVARACNEAAKPCSVCGEMAGDYATALTLLGLGFDGVSVVPSLLSEVKYAVRETLFSEAQALAAEVLAQRTSEGIRAALTRARERLHARQVEQAEGLDAEVEPKREDSKNPAPR